MMKPDCFPFRSKPRPVGIYLASGPQNARRRRAQKSIFSAAIAAALASSGNLLAASDLVSTLPAPAMKDARRAYRLESVEVPFALPPLPHAMVWCSGRNRDGGLIWLRERLRPIVKRHFAG